MLAKNRIYRTLDGRLVHEDNPDAAFLAYARGDEVENADVRKLPHDTPAADDKADGQVADDPEDPKKVPAPVGNKAVRQSPNK